MGTGATDDQVHLGDGLRDGHVVRDGDVGQRDQHVVVACEGGGGWVGSRVGGSTRPVQHMGGLQRSCSALGGEIEGHQLLVLGARG